MLFPYHFDSPLTPSAVKIQRENLKEFERKHFTDYSVFELIANRTQFCDDLLKQLWQQFELDKANLTLIAVGGYGRQEIFPLSDLDVLILSKEERESETEEKIATGNIGQFTHAHNQYLDDLSKRGIVGLLALLAVLFIPLRTFMKKLNTTNDEVKLIATLGVAHILSVMIYGLSQGFLVHNSGTIFYFFLTIVFYAAIRTHQKAE